MQTMKKIYHVSPFIATSHHGWAISAWANVHSTWLHSRE